MAKFHSQNNLYHILQPVFQEEKRSKVLFLSVNRNLVVLNTTMQTAIKINNLTCIQLRLLFFSQFFHKIVDLETKIAKSPI